MPIRWCRKRWVPSWPWLRSIRTVRASSGSSVTTTPPSPGPPKDFTWTKENRPASPQVPAGRPSRTAPWATAESSIRRRPWRSARARIRGMSAITENMWAGISALVRAVIRASAASGSMTRVRGSMSANTGVAPTPRTVLASGAQPNAGTITSSPAVMPMARRMRVSAVVPLPQAMTSAAPRSVRSRSSKRAVRSPRMKRWAGSVATSWTTSRSRSRSSSKRSGGKNGISGGVVAVIGAFRAGSRGPGR